MTSIVHAKKSLGQNFLRSGAAIDAIVTASGVKKGDIVLEIGPGEGVLTEKLLVSGAHVIAIEKDDRLIDILSERFNDFVKKGDFTLIHGDILEENIEKIKEKYFRTTDCKLIANIPYYITGQIIRLFVDNNLASSMTLLVQDEVAKRIVKRDGKESLLSLSIASYGTTRYIKKVPSGSFVPAPKVDSAIIHIDRHVKPVFHSRKERDMYFNLIHAGLAHKRKTLIHNVKEDNGTKNILGGGKMWESILGEVGLGVKARGEDVDFDTWQKIMRAIL